MPLSSIVVIVLRLFALHWLLQALLILPPSLGLPFDHSGYALLLVSVPAIILVILSVSLWLIASRVARLVSRGVDTSVNVGSLSRSDLYSFAFVSLGLYFILSSLGDVINWAHYFTVSHDDPRNDPRIQSLYQLTRPFLTLAVGVVSLLGAPRWTKMLVSRDQKGMQPSQVIEQSAGSDGAGSP